MSIWSQNSFLSWKLYFDDIGNGSVISLKIDLEKDLFWIVREPRSEKEFVLCKDLFSSKLGILLKPFLEALERVVFFIIVKENVAHWYEVFYVKC